MPEDDNVITPEEFEKLEEKEKKKKIFGFLGKPKPPKKEKPQTFTSPVSSTTRNEIDNLFLKVEKLEGRMEAMDSLRTALEEKLSRFSEEIGELRSAMIERDRDMDEIEDGFRKIKEITEEIEPSKINEELRKREEEIEKNHAKIESIDFQISEIRKVMLELRKILDKVKDVKNILQLSEDISRKMNTIEQDKKEISRVAGKVETMFSELKNKITEFQTYKERIDFNAESMHDIIKSIDMLEVKLENTLTKDDMKEIQEKFSEIEENVGEKIEGIKDVVETLLSLLKTPEGKKKKTEISKWLSDIESLDERIGTIVDEKTKGIEDRLKNIPEALAASKKDIESLKNNIKSLSMKVEDLKDIKKDVQISGKERKKLLDELGRIKLIGKSMNTKDILKVFEKRIDVSEREMNKIKSMLEQSTERIRMLEAELKGRKAVEKEKEALSKVLKSVRKKPSKGYIQRKKANLKKTKPETIPEETTDINIVRKLLEKADDEIYSGRIDDARNTYMQIVSEYEQVKSKISNEEAARLYDQIKKLYYRLQLYMKSKK